MYRRRHGRDGCRLHVARPGGLPPRARRRLLRRRPVGQPARARGSSRHRIRATRGRASTGSSSTHEHLDHLDLGAAAGRPRALAVRSRRRSRTGRPGARGRRSGASVSSRCSPASRSTSTASRSGSCPPSTASRWTTRTATGASSAGKPRFVGYVLAGGRRVYHSGDTIVTDALTEALTRSGSTSRCCRSTGATRSARRAASSGT